MRRHAPKRSPISASNVARLIADALASETTIVAAYVFGSVARAAPTPLSDIDVALLVAPGTTADTVCGRVSDELSRHFGIDRVDVVSLDGAPLPLRYRVVRDGVLAACRDRVRLERFVVDTVLQYLDFQPLRDRAFEIVRNRILATHDGR
jgi:hypothetical protein